MDRDALIVNHLKLVPPIARRVKKKLPPSFDLDDLISEGCIGLIRAAERYDPLAHGGTPFGAFARPRIQGAMVDSVRRKAWQENTRNPLDDAPEPATVRAMPYLITGPQIAEPKRRGVGRPTPFRPNQLPKILVRALQELTARQRVILGAFYNDNGTLAEIAESLHLSAAKVEAEHRAALDSLHRFLIRNLSPTGLDRIYFSSEDETPIAA